MVLNNSDSGIFLASDGNGHSNPCSPVSSVNIPGSELVENSGTLTCMIRDQSSVVYAVTCQHLFECLEQSDIRFEVKCAGVRGRYVRGVPTEGDQSDDCSKRERRLRNKEKRTEADIALVHMDNASQFSNVIDHPDGDEIPFAEYVEINEEKKNLKLYKGLVCVTNGGVTSSQKCRITGYTENDNIILGSLSDESKFEHASGDSGAPVIIHTDQLTCIELPIATQNDDRKNDMISQDSACVGDSRKPKNVWKLFAMVTGKSHSLSELFELVKDKSIKSIERFHRSRECEAQLFSSSISEVCKSPVLVSPHISTDTIPSTNGSNEVAAASSTFTTPPEDTRNQ